MPLYTVCRDIFPAGRLNPVLTGSLDTQDSVTSGDSAFNHRIQHHASAQLSSTVPIDDSSRRSSPKKGTTLASLPFDSPRVKPSGTCESVLRGITMMPNARKTDRRDGRTDSKQSGNCGISHAGGGGGE